MQVCSVNSGLCGEISMADFFFAGLFGFCEDFGGLFILFLKGIGGPSVNRFDALRGVKPAHRRFTNYLQVYIMTCPT